MGEGSQYSQEMAAKIDAEIKRLVDENYSRAKNILSEHRATLDKVADALLLTETVDGDEFSKLVKEL
jgi:cell division protease FtsH